MFYLPGNNDPDMRTRHTDLLHGRISGISLTPEVVTDQQGQVILSGLIPNATYQLVDHAENTLVGKRFQVVPGQQLDLKVELGKRQ
jgi:hypothetical protein